MISPSPSRTRLAAGTILALLAMSAFPLAARAQAEPAPTAAAESGETIYSLLVKGGLLMWPIGICSVVVLMFAIERAIGLRRRRTIPPGLIESVFETLPKRDYEDKERATALALLDCTRSVLGRVLREGVARLHAGAHATKIILEEAALKETHRMQRRLRPFAVVESLAPLLGLLGTVYGMITCFENAVSVDAASRAQSLAQGIYAALVTTAAGLSVAIPAKVLYHWFEARVDRAVDLLEEKLQTFLDHYFEDTEIVTRAVDPATVLASRLATVESDDESDGASTNRKKRRLIAKALEQNDRQ